MPPRLSVCLPTISGREKICTRVKAAYEETLQGESWELVLVKDGPTWPEACNEGFHRSKGNIVLFGADDLEPLPGWHEEVLDWMERVDELPAAKIYDDISGGRRFANAVDGGDLELTHFTRVPIMRRDQWERVGLWPPMIYFADMWVSEKARTLGIRTRLFYSFQFFHHWSQIGRVDSVENLDASGDFLNRLREEMV